MARGRALDMHTVYQQKALACHLFKLCKHGEMQVVGGTPRAAYRYPSPA